MLGTSVVFTHLKVKFVKRRQVHLFTPGGLRLVIMVLVLRIHCFWLARGEAFWAVSWLRGLTCGGGSGIGNFSKFLHVPITILGWLWFGIYTVVKVVLWSRGGAHLTKPGWSKPHTHSNPTNLALFRHKMTLYRFNRGRLILLQGGLKWEQGGWPP